MHKWVTKKGEAGKIFKGVQVFGNQIKKVYEDVPNKDIRHITFCVFGMTFTVSYPFFVKY